MVIATRGGGSPPWSSHVPGLVGPMLAAVIVTGLTDGRVGMRELARSCRRFVPARWLLVALSPLAFLAIALAVTAPFTGPFDWYDLGRFDGLPSSVGPIGVLVLLVVVNGIGEETGWRGLLQPTLQRRKPVRAATLTVAAVWAAWHAPLFLLDTGLGDMPPAMIPVWAVALTAGAIVLAWIHNHTASVLAVAVWHGTYNWASATAVAEAGIAALVTAGVIAVALVVTRRDPTLGADVD
jgi:membrane protease YdiL (CAAX protease family)